MTQAKSTAHAPLLTKLCRLPQCVHRKDCEGKTTSYSSLGQQSNLPLARQQQPLARENSADRALNVIRRWCSMIAGTPSDEHRLLRRGLTRHGETRRRRRETPPHSRTRLRRGLLSGRAPRACTAWDRRTSARVELKTDGLALKQTWKPSERCTQTYQYPPS